MSLLPVLLKKVYRICEFRLGQKESDISVYKRMVRDIAEQLIQDIRLPNSFLSVITDELALIYKGMLEYFTGRMNVEAAIYFLLKSIYLYNKELANEIYRLAHKRKVPLPDLWQLFSTPFRYAIDRMSERELDGNISPGDGVNSSYSSYLLSAFLSHIGFPRMIEVEDAHINLENPNLFLILVMYRFLIYLKENKKKVSSDLKDLLIRGIYLVFTAINEKVREGLPVGYEVQSAEEYINPLRKRVILSVLSEFSSILHDIARELKSPLIE